MKVTSIVEVKQVPGGLEAEQGIGAIEAKQVKGAIEAQREWMIRELERDRSDSTHSLEAKHLAKESRKVATDSATALATSKARAASANRMRRCTCP